LDQDEQFFVSVLANQPSLFKIALDGLSGPLKLRVDYGLNQNVDELNLTIYTSLTE
jgi:hypothetical protein